LIATESGGLKRADNGFREGLEGEKNECQHEVGDSEGDRSPVRREKKGLVATLAQRLGGGPVNQKKETRKGI